MIEKQQIEDLVGVLANGKFIYGSLKGVPSDCLDLRLAEYILQQGYRKIHKDDVVLTREEYDMLANCEKEELIQENIMLGKQCLDWQELYHKNLDRTKNYEKGYNDGRDAVVKEILGAMKKSLLESVASIDEIAKKYGVELD